MTYFKKKCNAEGKRDSISDGFPFDGIVISAICAAAAAAFFVIRSRADKPKV